MSEQSAPRKETPAFMIYDRGEMMQAYVAHTAEEACQLFADRFCNGNVTGLRAVKLNPADDTNWDDGYG
jgi:hypothetical protein